MTKATQQAQDARNATAQNGTAKKARPRRNELPDLPVQQQTLGFATDKLSPGAMAKDLVPWFIPLDKLRENPGNRGGVYDEAKVDDIARTLRVRQEAPIQVLAPDEQGVYVIHDGHYRYRAAQKARLAALLAIEVPPMTGAEAAGSRFVHNVQRVQLSPWQEALEFQAMRSHGYSEAQVATRAGVSEQLVRDRLKLVRLPPEVGRRIGEPGFGVAHAEAILGLVDHPRLMDAAASLIGKPERRGQRPPTADEFTRRVHEALTEKKLIAAPIGYNWRRDEVLRTKPYQDRVKALPMVTIGSGESARALVLDRAKYGLIEKQAVEAAEKRDAAQAARDGSSPSKPDAAARKKQSFEAKVRRVMRERVYESAARACKAVLVYGPSHLRFAARVRLNHLYVNQARINALAALTGPTVTRDDWVAWHREYDPRKKERRSQEILGRFNGTEARLLTALLAVEALTQNGDLEDEWFLLAPHLGVHDSRRDSEQKVRDELRAASPAKPAKGAARAAAGPKGSRGGAAGPAPIPSATSRRGSKNAPPDKEAA